MAARTPRYISRNAIVPDVAVLTASSAQAGFPPNNLKSTLRSKVWRTAIGWTVVSTKNNELDVLEGGVARLALIAVGTYATGTLYAAAVETALNAMAGAVNTYTCTYNTTTKVFTIARATGAATVSLLWLTGANAVSSPGIDLGFDTTADDTGATTYAGDKVAYQSRHYLDVDLGEESCDIDIVQGQNDRIDFTEAGVARVATITPGHYTHLTFDALDPTSLSTAVFVAMQAAAVGNTYTVTWNDTGLLQVFNIVRATGSDAFAIQWETGPNADRSVGPTLGYAVSDDTGGTDYESDDVVPGWPVVQVAIVYAHNMRFQGSLTLVARPPSNPVLVVLEGTDGVRIADTPPPPAVTPADQNWRLTVEDVQNVDGMNELRFWMGPYDELSRDVSAGTWEEGLGSLDKVHLADHGAHLGDEGPKPWSASGTFQQLTLADRDILEALFLYVGLVRPWWYFPDPEGDPFNGRYVMLREPFRFAADPEREDRFSTSLALEEDLP